MRELLDIFDGRLQTVGQFRPKDHGPHREQPRCQVFRTDDRIGHEIIGFTAPCVPRAAKSGDHLVRDHRDAVFLQDRHDRLEIPLRGRDDAAGTLHGFGEEARDSVGAFLLDRLLQLARKAGGELILGLALGAIAPEMRAADMDEARQRQAEDRIVRLAGHAGRDRRHAVIGVPAGDDLALLRIAFGGMHEPQHLDHGVVRFRPRVRIEHLAAGKRRDLDQLFRQHHGLVGHPPEERVIARKAVVLVLGRLRQALVVEARDHVPQARIGIQIAVAVHIDHIGAFAMGQHDRAALVHAWQVGEPVKGIFVCACFPALRCRHGDAPQPDLGGRLSAPPRAFNGAFRHRPPARGSCLSRGLPICTVCT